MRQVCQSNPYDKIWKKNGMLPYRIKDFGEVQTNCNYFHFELEIIRDVCGKGS